MPTVPKFPPMPGSEAFIHSRETGRAYWMQDFLWIILADSTDTGGRWSLMDQLMGKGIGPPPHKHTWSDETYYLLDGQITFLIGDDIRTAHAGDFVNVPRDTRHGFRVDSDTARILNGYTPASMEALVIEFGQPTKELVLPRQKSPMQSTEMPAELARRYGLDWLPGPDPLRPDKT
jgi:mannose-6-phosphate isomerase-like protein (cupin superfamily)